jgi:hypothetical protein
MAETITFRDYLRYLEVEIESKKPHLFTEGEEDIYASMRADLEKALSLPKYMLNSPLLASQAPLDQKTIQAISEIKASIKVVKPETKPILLSNSIYHDVLLFLRTVSLFLQNNKYALAAATVGLIGLYIVSSFLAPIQLVDSGFFLAGAAGTPVDTPVVEGRYITNVGDIVFWLGAILLTVLVIVFRKK